MWPLITVMVDSKENWSIREITEIKSKSHQNYNIFTPLAKIKNVSIRQIKLGLCSIQSLEWKVWSWIEVTRNFKWRFIEIQIKFGEIFKNSWVRLSCRGSPCIYSKFNIVHKKKYIYIFCLLSIHMAVICMDDSSVSEPFDLLTPELKKHDSFATWNFGRLSILFTSIQKL